MWFVMKMEQRVLCVTLFLGLSGVRSVKNPGEFNIDFYRGPTNRAIVAVLHKSTNFKEPKCYGTLVNWQVAVVPCSCVVRPLGPDQEGVWYDHYRKFRVTPEDTSAFKALLMPGEHHSPQMMEKLTTSVTKITLDPKCDSGFQYNMAKIELSKPTPASKIAWVGTPFQAQMKKILDNYSIGEPVSGNCIINQWVVPKNVTPNDEFPARIDLIEVAIVQWSACSNVVCPKNVSPPQGKTKRIDQRVCKNQVSTSRFCVEWEGSGSLCDITPGTPVFCNSGRLVGFSGFIHNSSMWCNPYVTTKQAVMEGIDLALPLIKYDLRVISQFKNKTGLQQ